MARKPNWRIKDVEVSRESIDDWLGDPATDSEVSNPAAVETSAPATSKRKINSDSDRVIFIKLRQAVTAIKHALPVRRADVTADTMAAMVVGSRDGSLSNNGYSFEVIKKMIDGTYEPANRRGFGDPWGTFPR